MYILIFNEQYGQIQMIDDPTTLVYEVQYFEDVPEMRAFIKDRLDKRKSFSSPKAFKIDGEDLLREVTEEVVVKELKGYDIAQ